MGREIRFRAWDSIKEKMLNGYQWIDGRSPCMGGGVHRNFSFLRNGRNFTQGTVCSGHHKTMQSTGLTDSKGVDIYEGDIVYISGIGNCVIEWCEMDLQFMFCKICNETDCLTHADVIEDVEHIIGNIHQNKELLE